MQVTNLAAECHYLHHACIYLPAHTIRSFNQQAYPYQTKLYCSVAVPQAIVNKLPSHVKIAEGRTCNIMTVPAQCHTVTI